MIPLRRRAFRLALALLLGLLIPLLGGVRAGAATACDGTGQPTQTVYLPNVTKTLGGPAGWDTPFYVQNAGAVQTTLETTFYRFSDGSLVTCRRSAPLPPGAALADDPNADADLPGDTQFSVVVRSFGAPIAAVVNQLQGSGASTQSLSYTGASGGATTVYLPNVTRRFFGYDVPFIVQNLGTATASVSVGFTSFNGLLRYTTSLQIAPGRSGVVDPNFTDGLVDGTQYSVVLRASQPIAVVANAHSESGSPLAYSHNGLVGGATSLAAPYLVKGGPGDLSSPIVLQNLTNGPVDATLTFTPLGGGAAQTFTLAAIGALASRAFDLRFAVGTTTPCAVASPTCLGNGEFSLAVSATGEVAAVVLPNSATSAAAYVAAAQTTSRAVLPVVIRGIGGWTGTPYVQSTGATTATARWYAGASGVLVTAQSLTLRPGSGVRLDPRGVPGLADGVAYALTLDGNGPLTAVVYEQAATGGDAAMIYEGLPTPPLVTTGGVGSVAVSPASASVLAGATASFTATVLDPFGAPAATTVAWSVTPATLGTVSAGGVFTAGSAAGAGSVVATSGAVTTATPVTVTLPSTATVGGIAFRLTSAGPVDVYTEATLSEADVQRIVAAAGADATRVQTDYAHAYASRPAVYALASRATYAQAIQSIGNAPAPPVWSTGQCCFGPKDSWLIFNWQEESKPAAFTAVRHEITHMMQRQLARGVATPQWLKEGGAQLEELTVAGTRWLEASKRLRAVSMASLGKLFALADLTTNSAWSARTGDDVDYEYAVAAMAVRLLRDDIGLAGEARIYELMGAGQSFDAAYATVAGRAFATFAAAFPGRVLALAPPAPAIATTADTYAGDGLGYVLYGFGGGASVTVAVTGSQYRSTPKTQTMDTYGFFASYLGSSWPADSYTITATVGTTSVTTVAAKASSFDDLAATGP